MATLKHTSLFFSLALLTALPVGGEGLADSLQIYVQAGDSCMQQYNTFEALKHYQKAFELARAEAAEKAAAHVQLPEELSRIPKEKAEEIIQNRRREAAARATAPCYIQFKLADCYYKRANFRQTADLLKNIPEDSLTHDPFRQLAYSYQKQGDVDSYIYWAGRLVEHYPMDGEMVAGLTLALAQKDQAWKGLEYGLKYSLKDSTNILVNRAVADAFFLDRNFTAAAECYGQLLEQGDSIFNTLYSAGMCYSQTGHLERAYECLRPALYLSQMQHSGCAYRLGVVCVDTNRYEEGINYLNLATTLLNPDTTAMRAVTLSKAEALYLTEHYDQAVESWKEHLRYNPESIATHYNIANACYYYLSDETQAKAYYEKFLELARKEEKMNDQLTEMVNKAESILKFMNSPKSKPKK